MKRSLVNVMPPNTVSRVMDKDWRTIGLFNNYSRISLNFDGISLYWLASRHPTVYQSILDADKESLVNFSGHGSAIAQVYNHMIMPLYNRLDKEAQINRVIMVFQECFKGFLKGMWFPETTIYIEALEVPAENQIRFTILFLIQTVNKKIDDYFGMLENQPENPEIIKLLYELIIMLRKLSISLNLLQSQNIAFKVAQTHYQRKKQQKDEASRIWFSEFNVLCELIGIRLA
jgi:hypothetical protein